MVIPKEIRRTMRIREGDPLEIYTSRDGEVIFKKYSLMGGLDEFAAQFCETLSKSCGAITAVTDRDAIIAVAGGGKRELMGKRISPQLEQIMEDRKIYQHAAGERQVFVTDSGGEVYRLRGGPHHLRGGCAGAGALRGGRGAPGHRAKRSTSWPRPSPPFWASTWRAKFSKNLSQSC